MPNNFQILIYPNTSISKGKILERKNLQMKRSDHLEHEKTTQIPKLTTC